jgi:hypothetical protein
MEWLEPITQLVVNAYWPLIIIFLVASFKEEVRDLLGRLREGEGPGGFKYKFDARVDEAAVSNTERDTGKTKPEPEAESDSEVVVETDVQWGRAGNVFWAGYDLMYTIDLILRRPEPALILDGITKASGHIQSLGLSGTKLHDDLEKIREGVIDNANKTWTPGLRDLYAMELKHIAVRLGAMARDYQKDKGFSYP